jgi:Holliday junction DNA helicase RuvA
LDRFSQDKLFSIINENRADLLSEIGGMGEKRSQRLILELKNKIKKTDGSGTAFLEENLELAEVLKTLGYKQKEIGEALKSIPEKAMKLEERLKSALAFLKR